MTQSIDCICKGNWRAIVKEYQPKLGFKYKDNKGNVYIFFGLVHAEDDYYYGLHKIEGNGQQLILATCVGGLDDMYEQLPNDGRCSLCNCVLPISTQKKCGRYRCPHGDNPL